MIELTILIETIASSREFLYGGRITNLHPGLLDIYRDRIADFRLAINIDG